MFEPSDWHRPVHGSRLESGQRERPAVTATYFELRVRVTARGRKTGAWGCCTIGAAGCATAGFVRGPAAGNGMAALAPGRIVATGCATAGFVCAPAACREDAGGTIAVGA